MIKCNFTTILWRIFLHCLPHDSNQWDEILEISRNNYEKLVEQYTIDPYKMSDDNQETQNLNHPLSRDENVMKQKKKEFLSFHLVFILEFMGTIFFK
jgi:hypothetical protein